MTSERGETLAIVALIAAAPIAAVLNPRETLWLWRYGNNPLYDQFYRGRSWRD